MTDPLRAVADLVLSESGMVIRDSQLPSLRAAVGRIAAGMTPEALLAETVRPGAGRAIVERLIDEVTIKETYFLRHREELQAIDWRALAAAAMAAGRSSVRAWSAACASGEEAYTLAILALEAFAPGQPPVDILATDIASSSIERGRAGRYGWRSVRHVDEGMRARWFSEDETGLVVGDAARRLVRFDQHNLLSDAIPPAGEAGFDLVVCRNVLIYFQPDAVKQTIERLQQALVPGGTLLLGAADRLTGGPGVPTARIERTRNDRKDRRRPGARGPRPRAERRAAPERRKAAPQPAPALDAEVEFERGVTALATGDSSGAVEALRRALYLDPGHAAAAFQLARAHDVRGDVSAARRAYWQALSLLEEGAGEVGGVARRDLEAASRARLDALGGG